MPMLPERPRVEKQEFVPRDQPRFYHYIQFIDPSEHPTGASEVHTWAAEVTEHNIGYIKTTLGITDVEINDLIAMAGPEYVRMTRASFQENFPNAPGYQMRQPILPARKPSRVTTEFHD